MTDELDLPGPTLIFDTETTGLVQRNMEHTDPRQPMPVQLGMKLDTPDRCEVGAINVMIRREGWAMEQGAMDATGLTNELVDQYGTDVITAVELFLDYVSHAEVIVAHNAIFDITVMRHAAHYYARKTGQTYFDPFEGKTLICTMTAATPICKMTPKRYGTWKWPKLSECIKFFWNEELEGAHDALVDVRACARVYYHFLDTGVFA